jgi:internalin A
VKYLNLKIIRKVLILISRSTFLLQTSLAIAMPLSPAKAKSFMQWCQQKNTLPIATSRTIDLLLQKAGTKNCPGADSKLRSLTELDLDRNQILDIKPLASLSKLTNLWLYSNQISERVCPVQPNSICKF